jgi:hypothetical protein
MSYILNTDSFVEGSLNLWFTNERAQNAVSGELNALDLRVDVLEERDLFQKGIAWENNSAVYANGVQPVIDPTAALREGWYFKNSTAGQKINWYYYDGINFADVKLSEMSGWAVVTFDSTQRPFFSVYTVSTGTNDARPGFAHSVVVYSVTGTVPVVGRTYLVYFGDEPPVRPELPRLQLTKNNAESAGEQLPTERVLTVALATDSGASVNTVQLMVEALGTYATAWRSQVDLKIRRATQTAFDSLSSMVTNNLSKVGPFSTVVSNTVLSTESVVLASASGGTVTLTLPSASSAGAQRKYTVKDTGDAASGAYVRVQAASGETVDGLNYFDLEAPYESITVATNGSNWFIL